MQDVLHQALKADALGAGVVGEFHGEAEGGEFHFAVGAGFSDGPLVFEGLGLAARGESVLPNYCLLLFHQLILQVKWNERIIIHIKALLIEMLN